MNMFNDGDVLTENISINDLSLLKKKVFLKFKNTDESYKIFRYILSINNFIKKNNLRFLGQGSSRRAFVLNSKYAIKVAYNAMSEAAIKKGLTQNMVEASISTDPRTSDIISHVKAIDDDYVWIISELVRKAHSSDFMKKLGVSADFFDFFVQEHIHGDNIRSSLLRIARFYETEYGQQKYSNVKSSNITITDELMNFVISLTALANMHNLIFRDFTTNNIGVTSSNRLVLLDYGFDVITSKLYYGSYT